MRRRIGIYGATDEALGLLPLLEDNPEIEVAAVYDPDPEAARGRAAGDPALAARLASLLTGDLEKLAAMPGLQAVVDAGLEPAFAVRAPQAAARLQVVPPLTARLLWGYGASARDHKAELLQALHEVVESYELTIDPDELFARMLEIALSVTGAERGSLMLLDPERRVLTVRMAVGIEPELWPKIRVAMGEGIAGRVAEEGRPLRVRGRADRTSFHIVRERLDVESALCVPLVHQGVVLGVLNLHHSERPDAFDDDDLAFVEQLAALDAQIIARAQEHETLRTQAERYSAVQEVRRVLAARTPLLERLGALCRLVARRAGRGIATVYLYDPDEGELRLAATSLAGGGFGGEYRIARGEGIDGRAAAERRPAFLPGEGGALAYAALPLLADERLVGLLAVQAGEGAPPVPTAREGLLEIAAATADAMAQAEREARMNTQATKVGAINEMGIRMLAATDPAEVVRLATSSGAMILEADHATLRLQDEHTGRYVLRSYFGSAAGREQERLFRLDKAVCVDLIKRRSATLIRQVDAEPRLASLQAGVRSLVASPLRREGRVVGTLAFYDKVAADRFYPGTFNEDDFQVFTRFVSYVERAVANAAFHLQARRHQSFDEETGLPNASYLRGRIQQEIARAGEREGAFALLTCRIESWPALLERSDPVHQGRVVRRLADALRTHLRSFDVAARTGPEVFAALLPELGPEPGARVAEVARAVAEEVAAEDALNEPERVALAFGYAVFAGDGKEPEALLAAASQPRIRMV